MGKKVNDKLGIKFKKFEEEWNGTVIGTDKIFVLRVDGKNFSKWTRGLRKPYDERLLMLFKETAKSLFKELPNLRLVYGQSDEISLLFVPKSELSIHPFGGRVFKLLSIVASLVTAKFNELKMGIIPEKPFAMFDCRVALVTDINDVDTVVEYFTWRRLDAIRNSKNVFAQQFLSVKELYGVGSDKAIEIVKERFGVDYYDLPVDFRRGYCFIGNGLKVEEIIVERDNVDNAIREIISRR
jgi:tRNA(His) 5'-end guanylyltransferase